jgi:hypothetical protein
MELVRVTNVESKDGFTVHVWFTNGTERDIDLEKYLRGPVFERLRTDPDQFRTVHVTEGRTIGWGDDLDIDPDTLYHDLKPAWMEIEELELPA